MLVGTQGILGRSEHSKNAPTTTAFGHSHKLALNHGRKKSFWWTMVLLRSVQLNVDTQISLNYHIVNRIAWQLPLKTHGFMKK